MIFPTFFAFEIKVDRKIGCLGLNTKLCSIVLVDSDQLRKMRGIWVILHPVSCYLFYIQEVLDGGDQIMMGQVGIEPTTYGL